MEDLSLHILDVAENSIAAGARNISITVCEDIDHDLLTIEIQDDGKGMSADAGSKVADPFYTTRTTRKVGLGIPLLLEAAKMAGGSVEVKSSLGRGTQVSASFQYSHIDRKPLGNMAETIIALLAMSDDIDIRYEHVRKEKSIILDTRDIRESTGGSPLNTVQALGIIRRYLNHEESELTHLS
jgi:anti-sigma regulatory factor (Ser/Thr protein kinase)